jgi:hypothetical protein
VEYPDVKEEMRTMLTDPYVLFNWKVNTCLWDGRTPLHSLAAYIRKKVGRESGESRKKVARNEKSPGEDPKREALFFRFRQAMTNFPEYKAAIDLACGEGDQTIDKAVEIAKRLQRTKADEPMKAGVLNDKRVGFEAAAGAYAEETDRIKMLEIGMAKMTTVEGLATEIRAGNSKTRTPCTRGRQQLRDRRDFNNGQGTNGNNRDRNESRDFRRRDDRRDQRRRERPEDDRTIFTKRKEKRQRAAEMMTDDENSEVEVDSDYEALCAVLDQQKLITDQQKLITDQQKLITDQQKLITDQQKLITDQQKLITDPVKDQTGVGSNKVPKL